MPEKFLIVDDDADSLFLAKRNLLTIFPSAEITSVTNGNRALDLLQKEPYDAIVTDYRMLEIDGITLTIKIRELGIKTPIVLRTAMEDLELTAKAAGVTHVLLWFRWRDLGNIVKSLIAAQPATQEIDVR